MKPYNGIYNQFRCGNDIALRGAIVLGLEKQGIIWTEIVGDLPVKKVVLEICYTIC